MTAGDCTFGLTMFASGVGPERFAHARELALGAERAGFDAVWASELYNRSATIVMATLAEATERVRIGSSIAYGVGRTPLVWAAEARDLDDLTAGRLLLGLGNGTAKMMEDWHGVSGEAPAVRMEELVEVLRKLWRLDEGRFTTTVASTVSTSPRPQTHRRHSGRTCRSTSPGSTRGWCRESDASPTG